ncbi:MAG TPA: hydantoinase/oxoprolinase family protein [Gemmataceae bacterium]|jgi:probable H4MPT-linked C1 transfer pathway protein|nr:hydantoinase/oxoprolinase family protein [Gemmataceae bacterium]
MSGAVLGLDIGGANLKAAHTDGTARSRPFALWKEPAALADRLRSLCGEFPAFDRLAVAMTGELCDCFATRREGVRHILDAVAASVRRDVASVYRTDGAFAVWEEAHAEPLSVAASNWLALAAFAGRFAPTGSALLVDIGSTTSDLIPLRNGVPVPTGRTDTDRLASGELVYTGVRRTPACGLLGGGGAAEFFATALDVYLLLDFIPENVDDVDTADGRPATRPHAHARLARMLCGDAESVPRAKAVGLAKRLSRLQQHLLDAAARRIAAERGTPETLIIGGTGEFLARLAFAGREGKEVSLTEQLGPERSAAACAHAVAVLLSEQT